MNFLDLSAYINDVYTWITQAFLAVVNSSEWFIDTIGSQIDNREIATLILSTLLFAFALIKIKNPVINGLIDIARSVLTPYLLIPFILLIGYSSGVIYIALQLKCWTSSLLLDTIIEITFVGIPSMYIAVKAHSIKAIFKQLVLPEISIGAFAVYYIGLDSFSIPAELLLQTIVLILVYTKTIYGRDQKKKTLVKKIDTILALIGIALLAIVTNKLVTNWNTVEWLDELQTFLMTIWYPVSMLPFAILLGYYSALEALLRRVKKKSS